MATTTDLPVAPEGWSYGVVLTNGRVWGCGAGEDGRSRQRMRLQYEDVQAPCLIGPSAQPRTSGERA